MMFQPVMSSLTNSLNSTAGIATGHNNSMTATTAIPNIIHNSLPFVPLDMGLPLLGGTGFGFILGLARR
jgi:hypothetical protein